MFVFLNFVKILRGMGEMQLNCNFCINDRLYPSAEVPADEMILCTVAPVVCLKLHLTQRLDLHVYHFLTGGKLSLLSSIA